MIVLDTHILIWLIEADPRLTDRVKLIIERERANDGLTIATITIWETAMLVDKGRVGLSQPVDHWFKRITDEPGFHLTDLTIAIGVDAGCLPGDIHGDPGDRLIIATARVLDCPVLTVDRKILAYAAAGHVQAIDARR